MNQAALLDKFRREALATASPTKLLTMLYDRLLLDLDRATVAIDAGDRGAANEQLSHAQQIIHELRCNLDPKAWDGGPQLMELYHYLYGQLIKANVALDADIVAECRGLIEPLREAWHQAAAATPTDSGPTAAFG